MIQSKKTLAGMASKGRDSAVAIGLANGWLEHGIELGLGTNNLDDIDLVEVDLTWIVSTVTRSFSRFTLQSVFPVPLKQ